MVMQIEKQVIDVQNANTVAASSVASLTDMFAGQCFLNSSFVTPDDAQTSGVPGPKKKEDNTTLKGQNLK